MKHLIELEENKHKLISLKERLKSIGEALRITELKKEIKELEGNLYLKILQESTFLE